MLLLDALPLLLVLPRPRLRTQIYVALADDQLRLLSHRFRLAARDRVLRVLRVVGAGVGVFLPGRPVGVQFLPQRLLAQKFEKRVVVLAILGL